MNKDYDDDYITKKKKKDRSGGDSGNEESFSPRAPALFPALR